MELSNDGPEACIQPRRASRTPLAFRSVGVYPQKRAPFPLDALPADIVFEILDLIPRLDYYYLKLAGSRRITDLVRDYTSRQSRSKHLRAIVMEDAKRMGLRNGSTRSALEITIERDQEVLVRHFLRKYEANMTLQVPEGKYWEQEKRAFRPALHWAAYYGSERITNLLLDRIDIRCWDSKCTALHVAAMRGHANIVNILLENGAEMNALDGDARTPLQLAVVYGQETVISLLRAWGAAQLDDLFQSGDRWMDLLQGRFKVRGRRPHTVPKRPPIRKESTVYVLKALLKYQYSWIRTPALRLQRQRAGLMRAAIQYNLPAVVNMLLDDGFGLYTSLAHLGEGITPLVFAVVHDRDEIAKLLTDRGADLTSHPPTRPNRRFWDAAHGGSDEMMRRCLRAGYPVNAVGVSGEAPLHAAVLGDNESAINLLAQAGADLNITRSRDGHSPVVIAIDHGCESALGRLLELGALPVRVSPDEPFDPNEIDGSGDRPIFESVSQGKYQVVSCLLHFGARLDVSDHEGDTPLHLAIEACDGAGPDMVELLASYGAEMDAKDKQGSTPLHCALSFDLGPDPEVVQQLVSNGADVNARDGHGRASLHLAIEEAASLEMIEFLLSNGADVEVEDNHGRTPLHYAAAVPQYHWASAVLKTLLDHRPPLDLRDVYGKTPLDLAVDAGNQDFVDILRNPWWRNNCQERTPIPE